MTRVLLFIQIKVAYISLSHCFLVVLFETGFHSVVVAVKELTTLDYLNFGVTFEIWHFFLKIDNNFLKKKYKYQGLRYDSFKMLLSTKHVCVFM